MERTSEITFLLSILHGITITDEFAEKVIEAWPVELCVPPVDGEELRRRREEIWHKWVGDDLAEGTDIGTDTGLDSAPGPGFVSAVGPGFVSAAGLGLGSGPGYVPAPGPGFVSAPGHSLRYVSANVPGPVSIAGHLSTAGPGHVSVAGPAKQNSDGTSLINPIIIDDSDEEPKKPAIPVLPRKFRVPPAAGLATPRSIDKSVVALAGGRGTLKVSPNSREDAEPITPGMNRACFAADDNTALPTPQSLMKQATASKTARPIKDAKSFKAIIKPKSSRSKGKGRANDNHIPDEDIPKMPFSLTSHRKRRPAIDYTHVHEDPIFDRSDEEDDDFQYEKVDDDERLDQRYEKHYPVLETPSKRQKRAKR